MKVENYGSFEIDLYRSGCRAVMIKVIVFQLGVFLFVLPVLGLSVYYFLESPYFVHIITAASIGSFLILVMNVGKLGRSVLQVDYSPTGFTMTPLKTYYMHQPAGGMYQWSDISEYVYVPYATGRNPKPRLFIRFHSGEEMTFYAERFKKHGNLPLFCEVLQKYLPVKGISGAPLQEE